MRRRGTVIVAVLVVTALSAMVAAGLLYRLRAEVSAASAGGNGEQAYTAAMSGIQRAVAVLGARGTDESISIDDNPELFANQLVCDDGTNKWYFSLYAPNADQQTLRYGLEDEAAKINLNTARPETLKAMLSRLPMVSSADEMVANLVAYRAPQARAPSPDSAPAAGPDAATTAKTGPLATIEELLLVKGFDAAVVYGEDANMNGILDPNEDDGDKTFPPDNSDGQLDAGLRGVATVVTHQRDISAAGRPRVNINGSDADLGKLAGAGIPKPVQDFIKAYRAEGNVFVHPSQLLKMQYQLKDPKNAPPGSGAAGGGTSGGGRGGGRRGQGGQGGGGAPITISSGVDAPQLAAVVDRLTVRPAGRQGGAGQLFGLVNVNTAPAAVLSLLPGMDDSLAQAVVDIRDTIDPTKKSTIAWLYTENLLSADKFKVVAPFLTARSAQYHVRCIGFGVPCGRFRVIEAILDLDGPSPRIAYLRDLTRLGLPAPIDVEQEEHSTK